MRYIDIKIINLQKNEIMLLSEAIDRYTNIILLGTPGSGKTSLLEQYQDKHHDSCYKVTVKEFIKFQQKIADTIDTILLDGLDEYRSFEKDKSFVIKELANKLKDYNTLNKIISCRELDWYGDNDSNALQNALKENFEVFKILPLDEKSQYDLISLMRTNTDAKKIIDKYNFTGLLENPQLVKMIVDIDSKENNLTNKKEIFETFINKSAKEHNSSYESIQINNNDIFKYNGSIAYFYMFSDVESFNDDFLSEISDDTFTLDILKETIKSKLYKSDTLFIHRTIAEYLCAKFIVDYKLGEDSILDKQRVKSLFTTKHNKIISELRGVYSWIGVLNKDMEFISIDPFYQLIYADNSFFNVDFKKDILLSIKEYATTNPFFISNLTIDLQGFYTHDLDKFIIEEFNNTIENENHYLLLLAYILKNAQDLSDDLKDFIKKKLFDNDISPHIKEKLLEQFDNDYIKEILNDILDDKIKDNEYNTLKEKILKDLYPNIISIDELIKYIQLYNSSNMMMQCLYLFDTKFENKYELVDELFKAFPKMYDNHTLDFDTREPLHSIKYFINEYFVEVCLNYEEKYNTKEIFRILYHFYSYSDRFVSLKYEANSIIVKDKLKHSDDKLQKLADELFEEYINFLITKGEIDFFDFDYIYSLTQPTDKSIIFLKVMRSKYSVKINKELFWNAMQNCKDNQLNNQFDDIAKQFKLEDEMDKFLNPPIREKTDWEIKYEEEDKERKLKLETEKEQIEKYFVNKSDDELLNSFNDLKWIYYYLSQAKGLINNKLRDRFIQILRLLLEQCLYKDKANINELIKNIDKHREIDMIYYEALIHNENKLDLNKLDNSLKEYLYLLAINKENVMNIDKPDVFLKYIKPEFALKVLKKAIKVILNDDILFKYIESINDIEKLKKLFTFFNSESNKIAMIDNVLKSFHFLITNEDLEYIKVTYKIDLADLIVKIKNNILLNQEEIIALYTTLFKFDDYNHAFIKLKPEYKIQIIYNMMLIFNDSKMLKFNNGTQTNYDLLVNFLNYRALKTLFIDDLHQLLAKIDCESIWYNSILSEIDNKSQNQANNFNKMKLSKLKKFINQNKILDYKDFYEEIILRLEHIKQEIEDNRNNQKELFFNKDTPKTENECRDIVMNTLKDKYNDISLTKEQQEANNRVDINIKYTNTTSFEIQVECKRDDNSEIYRGVKAQLIDKYFSTDVQYGIYMIFYFATKKNRDKMIKKIQDNIPVKYKNNIKILIINLRR